MSNARCTCPSPEFADQEHLPRCPLSDDVDIKAAEALGVETARRLAECLSECVRVANESVLARAEAAEASLSSLRQALHALIATLRDEDRFAGIESERRANEGDQVQRNRCIGLSAGYRDAADRLEELLHSSPETETPT